MVEEQAQAKGRLWGEAAAEAALKHIGAKPDASAIREALDAIQIMLRRNVDRVTIEDGYAKGRAFGAGAIAAIEAALSPSRWTRSRSSAGPKQTS